MEPCFRFAILGLLVALTLPVHAQISYPPYGDPSSSSVDCRLDGIDQFCLRSPVPTGAGPYGTIYVDVGEAVGPDGLPLSFVDVQPAIEAALAEWNEVAHSEATFGLPVLPFHGGKLEDGASLIQFAEGGLNFPVAHVLVHSTDATGRYASFAMSVSPQARWSTTAVYQEGPLYPNPWPNWNPDCDDIGAIDLQSVVTHELGHTLGLSHLPSSNTSLLTMQGTSLNECGKDPWWTRTYQRSVEAGDQLGKIYTTHDLGRLATQQIHPHVFVGAPPAVVVERPYEMEAGQELTAEVPVEIGRGEVLEMGPGSRMTFVSGAGLRVEGDLVADGATFTEAETGLGWKGIVLEGATADLEGVTVEHAQTGITAWPRAVCTGNCFVQESTLTLTDATVRESVGDGVRVYNWFNDPVPGSVTIQGSDLANNGGHGLYAALTPSTITVEPNPFDSDDESVIHDNGQSGVLADGAEIILDNTFVRDNGGSGAEAVSSGRVYVFESVIQGNARYGAEATNYGEVIFTRPGTAVTGANSLVQLNAEGGLFAERFGSINAGTANSISLSGGSCASACNNTIQNHATGMAPFDVSAESGSTVYAQLDWWGFDVDDSDPEGDLVLVSDASSLIEVVPTLDAPPGSGPRPSIPQALAPRLPADGSPAERSGDPEREALRAARVAAAEGAYVEAFELLRGVIVTSESMAYRRLAYTEATRLLRQAQPAPVVSFLEGVGEGASAYRPWALRALVVAYQASDRLTEAEAAAGALAVDYETEGHARYGQLATVRLRLFAGDLAGAQAALALAEGVWPGHPEVIETARVVALVEEANSEPESGARSGETADGASVAEEAAARGSSEEAEETAAGEVFALGAPYPNPSRGGVTLPLTLAAAAEVRVAIFDVPGREVAIVHEGPLAAGTHEVTLATARLPVGFYLVRATAGATSATQRVTVLR